MYGAVRALFLAPSRRSTYAAVGLETRALVWFGGWVALWCRVLKRTRLFACLALPFIALASEACVESDDKQPGLNLPEAGLSETGTNPAPDGGTLPGTGAESGVDGTVPVDAPVSTSDVVVTVLVAGKPFASATVVFIGATTEAVETGADGKAQFAAGSGTVTVRVDIPNSNFGDDTFYYHFVDVTPGDQLRVDLADEGNEAPAVLGSINVNMGAYPSATDYEVTVGCDTNTTSAPPTDGGVSVNPDLLFVTEGCVDGAGLVNLVAKAQDSSGQVLAWQTKAIAGPAADAGADGGKSTVTFASGVWQAATTVNFTATGGTSSDTLDISVHQYKGGLLFHQNADSMDLETKPPVRIEPVPGAVVDLVRTQTALKASALDGGLAGKVPAIMRLRQGPPPGFTSEDVNLMPPVVMPSKLAGTGFQPELSWVGQNPDAVGGVAIVEGGYHPDPDSFATIRWTFIFPKGVASVKAPVLPGASPESTQTWTSEGFALIESPQIPSYAAFKSNAAAFAPFVLRGDTSQLPKTPLTARLSGTK